nr:YciI family protein [uncultured Gellertiella sp.]
MLLLDLTYLVPLAEAEPHMDSHMTWVAAGYDRGLFLASGRKNPRTGGVILSRGERGEVEAWCNEDPFVVNAIAEYRITELVVSRTAEGLEALKS